MRKQLMILCAAVLLLSWNVAPSLGGEVFVQGEASVGAHHSGVTDNPVRVGEYVNLEDAETLMADMYLELFGGTGNALYSVDFKFMDTSTRAFNFNIDSESYVSADFGYQSFIHNLDHDMLQNLQAKEGVPDGSGGYNAGGKQIYHTDNDPLGRYFLEYEKVHGSVTVDLPFMAEGKLNLGYNKQTKKGYKQQLTIDHCAFCHVEGNTKYISRETESWTAGIQGTMGKFSMAYDFVDQLYRDKGETNTHRWKNANHPVNGGMSAEFGSRHIFEDVTLPYARSADTEKWAHSLGAKLDLDQSGTVKGSYTFTNNRNYWTGVESDFTAGALGYAVKLRKDMRLTAKFLTYETKVDDYHVNLPAFRATDLTGGNLDFDWTRISSANRQVTQGDINLHWKVGKGRNLQFSFRNKMIDRDAMAQNQTSYLFDGVNNGNAGATLVPSEAYANKTTENRIKLRYGARMGMKGRYNLAYTFTSVDKPFMNPTAMCEESMAGTNSAHVDAGAIGRLYYFQRERYGMGSSLPNSSHKFLVKGSYQLSPRTSVNAFVNYAKDKNDELNIYELERDILTPGINLWAAPSDNFMFTLGWTMMDYKSNANLCPPIFDG